MNTPKQQNCKRKITIALSLCLLGVFLLTLCLAFFKTPILNYAYKTFKAPTPTLSSAWENNFKTPPKGDIYVSKSGSDANTGTKQAPFLTIERALQAVASADKTDKSEIVVCIEAGTYTTQNLHLLTQHGGTETCNVVYYGDGEVVLNAGAELDPKHFSPSAQYPNIHGRLPESARDNVYILDLTKPPYSLTSSDWGKLYPIGTYNTADRYQGDTTGPMYSELFLNGERLNLARYPNDGYLYTDKAIAQGKTLANKPNGDPAGDVLQVNEELAEKIQSWENLSDVWAYGFWQYDWADGSSPLEHFDAQTNRLTTTYQSFFGVKENAPYFFYNCLEELDSEKEWYLDREKGLLCVYSSVGLENAKLNLSTSLNSVLSVDADFVTMSGLTFTGTRGNGIVINGNNNTVIGCKVHNIGGHAVEIFGTNNRITKSEICNTGKGGISVAGGEKTTLSPGNNAVSNNLIHDWSQVYKTYQAGIHISGVGNICTNNELFNSPHLAITYDGNHHILEYNLIHSVCLESDDAGAIYAGKSWSSYGNTIRYNLIYGLGGNGYAPNGIYMDDAISGQTIYGNILINIPKHAIFIGGGRDMSVYDNLIIHAGDSAIRYDARARDGLLKKTWFSEDIDMENGSLWKDLLSSPWKSEVWLKAFPPYQTITVDPSNLNDPNFMANPANSFIGNNIIFDKCASIGTIDQAVYEYSTVSDNKTYYLFQLRNTFKKYKQGDYTMDESSSIYPYVQELFNNVLKTVGRY